MAEGLNSIANINTPIPTTTPLNYRDIEDDITADNSENQSDLPDPCDPENIKIPTIFGDLTNQTASDAVMILDNTKGDANPIDGLYDENGLMNPDFEALQAAYLEYEDSGLQMTTNEDGTTTVAYDEDGDGVYDRYATYDANKNKTSETFDRDNDGKSEAVLGFDENGNVNYAELDTNGDGKIDTKEAVESDGKSKTNTVAQYDENGKIDSLIEYKDGNISAARKDNNDDGRFDKGIDYLEGEFSTDFGRSLETESAEDDSTGDSGEKSEARNKDTSTDDKSNSKTSKSSK